MNYFTWRWAAPALAAILVLVGYLSVCLFRWSRWFSYRRGMDMKNVGTVRMRWDRKTRLVEISHIIRRPWPLGKWSKARSFYSTLDQLLAPVPHKAIRAYVNKRLREDRRKGQDK